MKATLARRSLPNTDLKVSAFCYGVMRFNIKTRGEADFELYRQFREAGGNFFDTAHVYSVWLEQGKGYGDLVRRNRPRQGAAPGCQQLVHGQIAEANAYATYKGRKRR